MAGPRNSTEVTPERLGRRRTTTLKLLECLTSFSENVDPTVRGTEDDPHLSFVAALQNGFRERTAQIERDHQANVGGVSISKLINSLSSDSAHALTTKDLVRFLAHNTKAADTTEDPIVGVLRNRNDALGDSVRRSEQARQLSDQGRELHRSGNIPQAQDCFKQADELFQEAVVLLRTVEDERSFS